ncbi:arachidonate 5-lipoxygenase-activating protein [Carassius auratus]|uniref:Arachidonate 5-lipoxygenase-activating protein n=1 Tax=Carassius auratus TaxID=7957 RepID=A0A6P6Q932_CARAU|nr:arachidonate 5-lipoxygenase-activating protein-like [Carassius auratus]XP_052423505.1 arachidonate 5-lipoxygenase-activating protein [Carassius gibelio]
MLSVMLQMIRQQSETVPQCTLENMFVAVMDNIFLLVLVTLLSVIQNVFFALKVEKECTHSKNSAAFERLSCANRNCMDTYPTFLAVLWCAGICLSQAPAAFAGIIYLVVRQKYFVGYLGQTCQSTPGFLFGKRILFFLSLMCVVGIINHLMLTYGGSDYKEYIQTITKAASTLLLLP